MRRIVLVLMLVLLVAAFVPGSAGAAPTRCEGLFYGIEATCMFRLGGPNLLVLGAAYGSENPPAQIVVELFEWPVSVGDSPLARCHTTGGVLQACQDSPGTGLSLNTMLFCRVTGVAQLGAFACISY